MQLQRCSSHAAHTTCSHGPFRMIWGAALKLCSCHLLLLQVPQRLLMGPGPANAYPRILAAQVPCRPRHVQSDPHTADCCMCHGNHGRARDTRFVDTNCCHSILTILEGSPVEFRSQAVCGARHLAVCNPASCRLQPCLLPPAAAVLTAAAAALTAAAAAAVRPCPCWVTCTLPS